MNQYEQIMSINAVLPFVIGYSVHGVLAGIQLGIALVLFSSSMINLLQKSPASWLKYLGFTNNLPSQAKRAFGTIQLGVAVLLILPAIIDLPVWVSIAAFLFTLLLYAYYLRLHSTSKTLSNLSRYAIIAFSTAAIIFVTYEHKSPLQAMTQIAQDILTYRPQEQRWQNEFDINAPKVGQQASEFSLLHADGKTPAKLSEFLGEKPVVLFLGANSCPVFSAGLQDINRLHQKYKDSVNFVGVYVSEPHAIDEWPLARTLLLEATKDIFEHPVEIDITQHRDYSYRQWAAERLKRNLLHKDIPLLVDNMENTVNNRWVGRPARLYLISAEGKVIYNPGMGPYSFNPQYLEPLLEKHLAETINQRSVVVKTPHLMKLN